MDRRRFFSLAPAAALAAVPAVAQSEDGFTTLFNGQSLRGWDIVDGPESAFYAKSGELLSSPSSIFPCWLRSARQYENFDLRLESFVKGWIDGGVYLHAPEHGRPTWCGEQVKIFHQEDKDPRSNSFGALFPLVAPSKVNVKPGEWNQIRIVSDWPRLQVWTNGELVQDRNLEQMPEFRHRLRSGYLGLSGLGYPIRFRNIRIKELPSTERWENLYETEADFGKWFISETHANAPALFTPLGGVLRGDGSGHLATKEQYRDFQLHLYIRGPVHHNGGVLFRSEGKGLAGKRHYEVQLHNVEEAHYPTGSLYYFKRSIYPRIEDEKWYLLQLMVKDNRCLVRINGEDVMEYDKLDNLEPGHVELQAHQPGKWMEYKHIRIKRL